MWAEDEDGFDNDENNDHDLTIAVRESELRERALIKVIPY